MRRELRWRRRGLHRLFFFLVLVPMLCVFPYLRVVNNPNEFVRVFTVMSLVEGKTFCIDEQVQTFGWVNDMAKVKGKKDGVDHFFMVKGPGLVYLGVPAYFVFSRVVAPLLGHHYPGNNGGYVSAKDIPPGKVITPASQDEKLWWLRMSTWVLRIFATQIPCFLFLLWFERYLRDFARDPVIRYSAVAAAGLGTNFFAYTQIFASHSQYAAIAFLALATIEKERRRADGDVKRMHPSRALLAGFLTSAVVTLEYHSLLLAIVLSLFGVFTFWSPLRAVFWVLGAIPPLSGLRRLIPLGTSLTPTRLLAFAAGGLINVPHMMYFHWSAYGNPFTPGHLQLETQSFVAAHRHGIFGIVWPSWQHIQAIAVDPGAGFFSLSPYMWIGLVFAPLVLFWPKGGPSERTNLRIVTVVWLACMAMAFGVNAGFVEWRGGWTIGPRYLVVCAPFFAFGGALALERIASMGRPQRVLARGLGGGLAFASVVTIGTVGLTIDTLPEAVARPFAQFFVPMARVGFVPHHIGEWFGFGGTTFWYVACAALLLAPLLAALAWQQGDLLREKVARFVIFAVAFAAGMITAVSAPDDKSELFKLHPAVQFIGGWEPPGRDRISVLRTEAERLGTRGNGPCLWYRIADLERVMNQPAQAARDDARAKNTLPKEQCHKLRF